METNKYQELLLDSEIMQEFDDSYWIKVDKELYDDIFVQSDNLSEI
jgi:hypothetical protein